MHTLHLLDLQQLYVFQNESNEKKLQQFQQFKVSRLLMKIYQIALEYHLLGMAIPEDSACSR